MALPKYPERTHPDNGRHDGWKANQQRIEEALHQQDVAEQILFSLACFKQRDRLPPEIVNYHWAILHHLGLLEQIE